MKEAEVGLDEALMAHQEPPKPADPGERPLDDPAVAIASQFSAILMRRLAVVAPRRNDRLDAAGLQRAPQGIAVVAPIGDQTIRVAPRPTRSMRPCHGDGGEGLLEERDLRRGRRVQVCSQRSTRAIDQKHPLRTFASLCLPDLEPPFFAGAKLPSAKHSSQRSFSRSFKSARKARHRLSSVSSCSQVKRRRQQVVGLPYLRGSSLQGAPVHKIQRMPSKHFRSSARGRPPRGFGGWAGRCSLRRAHCTSVSLRHAIGNLQKNGQDRKSTRLNSSHRTISYAVFCLKKKKKNNINDICLNHTKNKCTKLEVCIIAS